MSEDTRQIEESVEAWARARLDDLAAEAAEVASQFYVGAAQERAQRPRDEWGRLGVRVRPVRAVRAAPGAFSIEWFTRRWVNRAGSRARTFTTYLRRGKGDRYSRSALAGVAQPWELALADALEERFAEIRRLARDVSRVRMVFRQHAKLERMITEGCVQRIRSDASTEPDVALGMVCPEEQAGSGLRWGKHGNAEANPGVARDTALGRRP
jgi:hypothetical protein